VAYAVSSAQTAARPRVEAALARELELADLSEQEQRRIR
jgi:hypothetical protein